jgi:hypothetical protein
MVLKNIVPANEMAFTRAAYYWIMMIIDHFQKTKEMLNIDYESYVITQTVVSHFLNNINKEEEADWKKMWELTNSKKAKDNFSKPKLIISSISLITGLPKETVRRKLLELNKKKILVSNRKKGLQLGEKFERFHKKFLQHTTIKISEMLNKWEKIGALEFILNVDSQQIPSAVKSVDKTLKSTMKNLTEKTI